MGEVLSCALEEAETWTAGMRGSGFSKADVVKPALQYRMYRSGGVNTDVVGVVCTVYSYSLFTLSLLMIAKAPGSATADS